jgi:NAD(P)-dependent dehydrogenase (short-subunit alcohol dehydrogenase family)
MSDGFASKIVVITGAARGMGTAYARAFHERGAVVFVADINSGAAAEVAAQLGARAHAIDVDVSDEERVAALFEEVENRYGRLDVLINNAALMLDVEKPFKPFWELNLAEWRRVMDVNAAGVFLCTKHALPLLKRADGGKVVNVSSDAIWHGYAGQLAYFASKGAVAVMNRCLARELGEFNINVNAIAPGLTESESVRASEFLRNLKPMIQESRALKRDQVPQDLVGTVLFLCSPESACITGQTIVINSGGIMP